MILTISLSNGAAHSRRLRLFHKLVNELSRHELPMSAVDQGPIATLCRQELEQLPARITAAPYHIDDRSLIVVADVAHPVRFALSCLFRSKCNDALWRSASRVIRERKDGILHSLAGAVRCDRPAV